MTRKPRIEIVRADNGQCAMTPELAPRGYDMSKHWRLVIVENGLVSGTWWVSRTSRGGVIVRPVDVILWDSPDRNYGFTISQADGLIAFVQGGEVHISPRAVRGRWERQVLDHLDEVKAAALAAANGVTWEVRDD